MAPQKAKFNSDYLKEIQIESMKSAILNNFSHYEGFSWKWRAFMIAMNQPFCFCSCRFSTFPVYYAVNYLHFYKNVSLYIQSQLKC